jgi:LmbE family N-acetylglucosaminyl deacetylase
VVAFSAHDDDALIGAGHLLLAAQANGGQVSLLIFCNGCAGYSVPEQRETIVAIRRRETIAAYGLLGISAPAITRLDYPDFSVLHHVGWQLPAGGEGTFSATLPYLRRLRATRLLVPNGYREHIDHSAVSDVGAFDGPQVGDAVIAEWGTAPPLRTVLEYATWGDFSPEDALVHGAPSSLRANRALAAPPEAESLIFAALRQYESQQQIIGDLTDQRQGRRLPGGRVLELYHWFNPRPPLDYAPYRDLIQELEAQ